jgi:hypothetical protein
MKNLLNLKGAQKLSTQEQQSIAGGHNCTGPAAACWYECGRTCTGYKNGQGVCICP